MKNGFVLYSTQYDPISELSYEQKGKLFDMIFKYNLGEDVKSDDIVVNISFNFFKKQFEMDSKKYEETIVKRNKANGKLGGRPKTQWDKKNPDEPKKADNDNVNDNVKDNDKDNVKENKKEKRVVASFDDFITRLVGVDRLEIYPAKNIEIEKKKCWNWWTDNNKKMKEPKKAFRNRLEPKSWDKEYIEGIKEKTDDQWIKERLSGKRVFEEKYGNAKYTEVKEKWIQQCLNQPLSLT